MWRRKNRKSIFEVNYGSTPSFYIKEGGGGQSLMCLDTHQRNDFKWRNMDGWIIKQISDVGLSFVINYF